MTSKLSWIGILVVSMGIFVLRTIDFIDEASRMDFHMTRAGLHITGNEAMFMQVFVIMASALILMKASRKLS